MLRLDSARVFEVFDTLLGDLVNFLDLDLLAEGFDLEIRLAKGAVVDQVLAEATTGVCLQESVEADVEPVGWDGVVGS
jgi:hypothetical protein